MDRFKKRCSVTFEQVLSELLKNGIFVTLMPWHAVNECVGEWKLKVRGARIFKAEFKDSRTLSFI